MAEVKINRELLTDLVDDLQARHYAAWDQCCTANPCPTAQRIQRARGVMERNP